MADQIRGIAFPFRIDPATGGVATESEFNKLRQNVRVLLGTRLGERPMLPDYGTPLAGLVHDPNDAVLVDLAQRQAVQAVLRWEPRLLVTGVQPRKFEGELHLHLSYVLTGLPAAGADQIIPLR
ncbi:MAG: GPW/gp25 family protein [Rhodothermaceae bacterium]|nr:GPW/gp25 family protein [Rhodothermaceae bacterium]